MNKKACSVCGNLLPNTREYFVYSKRDGLASKCKKCRSKIRTERYANSPALQAKAQERAARWAKENPERSRNIKRDHYEANREKAIKRTAQWRKDNPEKYKENNAGRWDRYKNDPKMVLAYKVYDRNYRTRKMKNGGTHTPEELEERIEEQGYMCFYCSHPLEDGYHIDHFVPVSKGGGSEIENLVASCPTCNLSKGDKDPHKFMAEIGRTYI